MPYVESGGATIRKLRSIALGLVAALAIAGCANVVSGSAKGDRPRSRARVCSSARWPHTVKPSRKRR